MLWGHTLHVSSLVLDARSWDIYRFSSAHVQKFHSIDALSVVGDIQEFPTSKQLLAICPHVTRVRLHFAGVLSSAPPSATDYLSDLRHIRTLLGSNDCNRVTFSFYIQQCIYAPYVIDVYAPDGIDWVELSEMLTLDIMEMSHVKCLRIHCPNWEILAGRYEVTV